MPADGEAKLYLDQVKLTVKGATQQALEALAFEVEGQAKINIQQNGQVDTGFLLNSVYTITPASSGFAAAQSAAALRAPRSMAPAPQVGEGAAVVVGAEYAIYQEIRKAFLYPAGVKVAQQAGGKAERVYREVLK